MRVLIHLTQIWLAAITAIVRTTLSRMMLGSSLPSWMWRTEWAVAVARNAIAAAASQRDDPLLALIGSRVRIPLSVSVVGSVRITKWQEGSRVGDEYERVGSTRNHSAGGLPTILYFHGGGYVFGNPGTHREHIARLVERTGARVIAPSYRLAPAHKFPAAIEDAVDAYRQLLDSGIDPSDIIVSGDSAGGGLTLGMIQEAQAEALPMPAGLILFSPYVDLNHKGYTIRTNAATDYLPLREMSTPNDWYVSPEDLSNPKASPINADLTGFPEMLIFVGGAEMLLADARQLAEHAERDGVAATLVVAPDMPHVWPAIVPWEPASRKALEQCAEWIPTVIG